MSKISIEEALAKTAGAMKAYVDGVISGDGNAFSETGEVVELAVEAETPLAVVSKIHRDSTWGLSDKLVLHQVSGSNFVDLSAYLGGAGTVFTSNGLTATVNADSTVTIKGTNESTGWTNIISKNHWSGEHAEKVYPAGTYTIPAGFMINVRAAQYPENVTIDGVGANLKGTVTIPECFRIVSIIYAVGASATVDVTLPLGLFRGDAIPETGYEYSGNIYTATFDAPVYEGEFNWSTGELKDADGNTVAYYDSRDIASLPGTNYFWTGFGENTVSNVSEDLGKVVIQLNETAPEETVASICDFLLRPTTPTAVYWLHDGKVLPNGGVFFGHEIPLITTKGTLAVVDARGDVITEKYVDALINHQGVSDALTNKGIHKAWSGKFYFTKEPVAQEDFSYSNGQTNSLYTFEFTEDDFRNVGLPAKLDNIPIVSPCFYTEADAGNKLNQRLWGTDLFPATLSWDEASQKYIFKVRGFMSGYIMSQLQYYSRGYLHYQLETPYDDATMFAMGVSSGDKITFTVDDDDWKPYLEAGLYKGITEVDVMPTVATQVPRSATDACDGMINAARMLNNNKNGMGGDATVQGYSWIGEGDGTTDYTARIQSKLDEIHAVTNGGTVYLGPGTYPISGSLIIYSNTRIIGYGVDTIVHQNADNTDAIIVNGNDVTLKDFSIKLAGACTEITACVYANSDNQAGENGYPSNFYVSNLTMDNIFMSGNYRFEHVDGKPILGDVYHNYKGVGIFCEGLYFNYAHIDNVHGKYLMAVVYWGGGGNYFNITSEFCKYAVYNGGVNNIYFINGHSYYEGNDTDGYVSMSDEVVHDEDSHFTHYTLSLYDCQHFKHYIYFGGESQTNSFTLNANFGASITANADDMSNPKYALSQHVIDLGRGNIQIAKWQDNAYAIGNKTFQISGQTTMVKCDPVISNVLSGAGVWGNITSNITWQNVGIDLYEICRYKADRVDSNSYLYLPSVISEASPSEDAPIEIEIDVRNRPIYGQLGHFIQFDHRYVASEYIVYYDTENNGEYDISYTIKDNVDVTCWMLRHQNQPYNIYRIKFVFTKALQIPEFTYQDSAFRSFTIDYNPEGLIGICNIGMTVNDYAGRSFLGECGGSLYGNVDMHQNTLKNLSAPVEDGDAVSKAYLEQRFSDLPFEDGTGGGASIDVTAAVGQTIVVKEIDANGKPTKWESADYPLTENEIIPQTACTPVYSSTYGCFMWNFANNTKLIAGQKYTVVFDGVKYSCTAQTTTFGGMNLTFIGNSVFIGNDTGEPFALASIVGNDGYIVLLGFDGNEHTVGLSDIRLNDAYIPLSAYPYYIDVTGEGTDDDPYVCDDTVVNVRAVIASGRPIHMKLHTSIGLAYMVFYLSQFGSDGNELYLYFTNPHNYAGGGDALNTTIFMWSQDDGSFLCRNA